ncbi:MAG: PIG-L deacetylase family protein [Desulfobacterales bacterium]|nr:PIG-L deacetylase family protein [Desulfobacterales bacterium]
MATILAVSAHPDDETLFAGGTLAKWSEAGHNVYILETTRGEGGEVGEPALTTQENLGPFREREVRKAAEALGAREIYFLPFIDPHMEINGIARRISEPLDVFVDAITRFIKQIQPDVVLTHGSNGEYGHPQHIYTHEATRLAMTNGAGKTALLSWSAWYESPKRQRVLNRNDRADIIHDIGPWLEKKVAAALCHRTQHAMFLRNTGAPSVSAMIWPVETFHIWQGKLPAGLKLC